MTNTDNPTQASVTLRSPGDILAMAGNLLHYPNETLIAMCFTPDRQHEPRVAPPAGLEEALHAWTQPGYVLGCALNMPIRTPREVTTFIDRIEPIFDEQPDLFGRDAHGGRHMIAALALVTERPQTHDLDAFAHHAVGQTTTPHLQVFTPVLWHVDTLRPGSVYTSIGGSTLDDRANTIASGTVSDITLSI